MHAGGPRDLMLIPHPHSLLATSRASCLDARIGEGAGGPCCNHGPRFETGHLIIVAVMSGAISGISLPFRADPVLLNPAPTQGGIRVTNPSVYSYSSLSAASCKPRARNAGRPARSVFQDTMIVSRGEAWIRKVDGCSAARSLLLLLPNMGLDRGRQAFSQASTHTSSFFSPPSWPLHSPSSPGNLLPPPPPSQRVPFWSCSRPDRSAPFTRPFSPPVSIAPA
jgi:hypothetical protein